MKTATKREESADPAQPEPMTENAPVETMAIPIGNIYAKQDQNNRAYFDPIALQDLADDIAANGLLQPIGIREESADRYSIVFGERRYRAHLLANLPTIEARIIRGLSDREFYLATLKENSGRAQVNAIEEAIGFHRAIHDHGASIEELAGACHRRIDYIDRRLKFLNILPEYQHMLATGQLGAKYGEALSALNSEYQKAAIDRLVANQRDMTLTYFQNICNELLVKQNTVSLFDLSLFSGIPESGDPELEPESADRPLRDPSQYAPVFDPLDLIGSIDRELATWRDAVIGYEYRGKQSEARASSAIVLQLQAMREAIEAADLIPKRQTLSAKILKQLSDRESMTKREVMQYTNTRARELAPVLESLENTGQISSKRSGRGYRYSLA